MCSSDLLQIKPSGSGDETVGCLFSFPDPFVSFGHVVSVVMNEAE